MRSRVLLMSSYLLLIIAAYSVTKAVRDSLFVTKIGQASFHMCTCLPPRWVACRWCIRGL
jgi:ATP/ADP translocase